MADAEPLFALLEIMLRTFNVNVPKVKPGGHPDDVFIRLTDEEREEFECSICYQVIKESRQCINNHKFCYSCIFVWSTSGNPVNHGRCPVCRADGNYVRNKELDEKINKLAAKCATKGCKWVGPLKHLPSHRHTNYSDAEDANSNELPVITPSIPAEPRTRLMGVSENGSTTMLDALNTPTPAQPVANTGQQRHPLANVPNNTNNSQNRSTSVNNRPTNAHNQTSTRSRTRSRTRTNASSPQRRSNTSVTGLNNTRLTSRARMQNNNELSNTSIRQRDENSEPPSNARVTSRARIQNGQNITSTINRETNENSENVSSPSEPTLTPRPPATPRPQVATRRRVPTLPNLMSSSNNNDSTNTHAGNQSSARTDNNNNISESQSETPSFLDSARRNPLEGNIGRRVAGTPRGFANVRDRLNESRQRLDMLMNAFSVELDRGRHDLSAFQQERERRRQEQLAEVRDLGIRLGQVATELRGLLSQRRQIRTQIDHMVGSSGTEETE